MGGAEIIFVGKDGNTGEPAGRGEGVEGRAEAGAPAPAGSDEENKSGVGVVADAAGGCLRLLIDNLLPV